MNVIFDDLIQQWIELYIDDVVVKSVDFKEHLENLEQAFLWMRKHSLKINLAMCAFGVCTRNFLGFLVHQ